MYILGDIDKSVSKNEQTIKYQGYWRNLRGDFYGILFIYIFKWMGRCILNADW